jgi:hypothetical protein
MYYPQDYQFAKMSQRIRLEKSLRTRSQGLMFQSNQYRQVREASSGKRNIARALGSFISRMGCWLEKIGYKLRTNYEDKAISKGSLLILPPDNECNY